MRYVCFVFFQAEDGIRDLVRSRGLGDVYKRQELRDPLSPARYAVPGGGAAAQASQKAASGIVRALSLIHI